MRTIRRFSIAIAAMFALAVHASAQDALSVAKGLYESASYAEALSAVSKVPDTADLVEVEKYRALCLLALGRLKEAEQSLETLALNRPLYTFDERDAPPRLVSLYQDVRRRTLPEASKQLYQRARKSFDSGNMADARREFQEVLTLAESAPQEHAAFMAELKMLATGFVKLTESATKAEAAPVAMPIPAGPATSVTLPAAPPSPSATAVERPANARVNPDPTASVVTDTIYDASNPGVRPPVVVNRTLPVWTRPVTLRHFAFQGTVEIVVGEDGNVLAATMARPIHVTYDGVLLSAARRWRFDPATAAGRPVKYRLNYSVTLPPEK